MGVIRFYEGLAATKHYIGKLSSDVPQCYNLSLISAPLPNEQALSCTLLEVKPGTRIRLFNSPVPADGEGCTEITVRQFVEEKCVPGFSENLSDSQVEVKVRKGKGEPGKVCRIEVVAAG